VQLSDLVATMRDGAPADASASCAEILRRFGPLFKKHWIRIYRNIEPSGMAYEDFVQEIAIRMIRYVGELTNTRAFPGYLQTIVASTAADAVRTARRQISESALTELVEELYATNSDGFVVRAFLDKLPAEEARIVDLMLVQDLDVRTCAQLLGISERSVRLRRQKALRNLQAIVFAEEKEITKL
jgi:RNA polymerase sigma factor (sigma-70 family)